MTKFQTFKLAADKYLAEVEAFFGFNHGTTLTAKDHVEAAVTAAQAHPEAADEAHPQAPVEDNAIENTKPVA